MTIRRIISSLFALTITATADSSYNLLNAFTEQEPESRSLLTCATICPGGSNVTYVARKASLALPGLICCPTSTVQFNVESCGFGCCDTCPYPYLFKNATCENPAPCKNGTSFFNISNCGCGCKPACPSGTGVFYFFKNCTCGTGFSCPGENQVPFSIAGCGCGCRPDTLPGF